MEYWQVILIILATVVMVVYASRLSPEAKESRRIIRESQASIQESQRLIEQAQNSTRSLRLQDLTSPWRDLAIAEANRALDDLIAELRNDPEHDPETRDELVEKLDELIAFTQPPMAKCAM